jgi:two-component system response regulator YesN
MVKNILIDVLIVDDEFWVTQVIQNLIDWEKEGFHIISILNDGVEACEMILKLNPSIVLTDIKMPGMDGLTMIKKARQAGLETQFIIISGHNDFKYAKDALEYGAAGYLLKPIDQEDLQNILDKVKGILINKQLKEKKELHLKQNLEKCVRQLKEQFFLDYFQHTFKSQLDIDQINNKFSLKFSPSKYQVIILSLDNIKKTVNFEKITNGIFEALLNNSVYQNCDEMIAIPNGKRLICILNYMAKSKDKIDKAIINMHRQIINENNCRYDFSVFHGSEENDINKLKRSYKNALNLFHSRIALNASSIYKSTNTKYGSRNLPPEKEVIFRCLIEQMEITKAKEFIDDMLKTLYSQSYKNPLLIYYCAEQLIDIIIAVAKNMGHDYANIENYLCEKKENLEDCASVEQVKSLLYQILNDMEGIRNKVNRSKNQKIIDIAKRYILENYNDDISLNKVAEIVFLTPNYLSEIFSKEEGCTFKEFGIRARIEIAKKLLGDLQYKTNDIAGLVGYADAHHFSKLFKKHTGLTPSEYRKLFF